MNSVFLIAILALFLFLAGGYFCYKSERKLWNNGYCQKCGKKLKYRDMDSQGGRLYMCDNYHSVWVSWPVEKERKKRA